MVRLATWMPFRPASRELAFFTGVEVAEATIRHVTEQAGAAYVRIQEEQTVTLLREQPESPAGPKVELMSVDGCFIQMVGGEWKEVKTVALGVVKEPVEERGEQVVHTRELTYFSRMSESGQFQQAALVEIHERGVEKAETVCAVSDGAEWIPTFVDYHRADAVRILDFAHAMEYVTQAGQAAHEHLPCPEELTTMQERSTFKQVQFQQWLKRQRHELKTGEVGKVLDELSRLQTLMRGVPHRVSSGDDYQEAGLSARTASDAGLCDLSSAGLSHWEWQRGECQQARGAKPHERSRHALGTSTCQRHPRAAQLGL